VAEDVAVLLGEVGLARGLLRAQAERSLRTLSSSSGLSAFRPREACRIALISSSGGVLFSR
jgi:hypothetical protein